MSVAGKQKYYVVWEGNNPGVYDSWAECLLQVKGYPNARYKAFPTKEDALEAFRDSSASHLGQNKAAKSARPAYSEESRQKIIWDSISVDAACSGNPGLMEYQGVDTRTKAQIFHKKFELGTNNIGEFLAIVHALALFQQQGRKTSAKRPPAQLTSAITQPALSRFRLVRS